MVGVVNEHREDVSKLSQWIRRNAVRVIMKAHHDLMPTIFVVGFELNIRLDDALEKFVDTHRCMTVKGESRELGLVEAM